MTTNLAASFARSVLRKLRRDLVEHGLQFLKVEGFDQMKIESGFFDERGIFDALAETEFHGGDDKRSKARNLKHEARKLRRVIPRAPRADASTRGG